MACNRSEWRSVFAMLAVDVMLAVMNTMVKKVMEEGMNKLILITLRQLIATLFMAPIAYFHERKTRPKLTVEIFVYIFFSALIGMESLNPKTKAGIAKAIGATVCFTGVIVLMFYKGVALNQAPHRSTASAQPQSPLPPAMSYTSSAWLMASLALLAGCFCLSSWFPLQSKLGEKYPALYSCTALMFFLSFLQTAAMSLATVRGHSVWLLRKKLEIATVIFSGFAGSGLGFLAMSWCVEQRGPVFTAAFMPFVQIFGAGIDFTILHEQVYLGSVLGSVLVIAGLYSLLWGKNKEARSCAAKAAEGNGENQVQVQLQSV
ncbi:WAT1-related protein At3g30340-like isoform X2 [Musa acuminata AAA Group]|uniref:WAT1-related protein At3g30340-like isoform X2 n=1 Tax=Musa acuminata AAA Group TaxID=214697 RepID=UPI0031E138E5